MQTSLSCVTKRADIAVPTATSHTTHTARSQSVGLHNGTQSLTAPLQTSRDPISDDTQALTRRAKVVSTKTSFFLFLSCRQLSHRCLPSPPHVSSLQSRSLMTMCGRFNSFSLVSVLPANRSPFRHSSVLTCQCSGCESTQ